MDYKLKTLHRIYNFFKIIEIALFTVICLLPIGAIIGLIIANATNNLPLLKIFSLLGVGSFIFIILVISITGGNLIVPASAFMAECEYRDIISKSKVAAIEEKYLKTKQAQERELKLDYIVENFSLVQRLIHKEEKEWQKEHSALGKKLDGRKPKFLIGMTVYEKKYGKLFTYTIHKISDLGEQGFIYTCIKHTCFITREERQFMEDEIEKTEEILSNNKLDGKKK